MGLTGSQNQESTWLYHGLSEIEKQCEERENISRCWLQQWPPVVKGGVQDQIQTFAKKTVLLQLDYQAINEECKVELKNKFHMLATMEEETTPDELWTQMKTIILETAEQEIPEKERMENQWISNKTLEQVSKRRKLKAKSMKSEEARAE